MILNVNEEVFSIVIPFLIYYTLLFAFLEKIRFFNKRTNSLMSILISILGTYSLYKMGFSTILSSLAAIFIVSIFAALFFFGVGKKSSKYLENISFGERNNNLNTTPQRNLDAIKNNVRILCTEMISAMESGDNERLESLKRSFNSNIAILKNELSPEEYENFKRSLPQQCQALIT